MDTQQATDLCVMYPSWYQHQSYNERVLQFNRPNVCPTCSRLARCRPAATRAAMSVQLDVSMHVLSCLPVARSGATPRDYRILPEKIILVRHAESEGNVDNKAYTYIPDSQVPLVGGQFRRHTKAGVGKEQLWASEALYGTKG